MGSKLKYYLNRTGMDIMDRLSNAVDGLDNCGRNQAFSGETPRFSDRLKDKILDSSLGQRISVGLTNFYAYVENNGAVFLENDGQIDEEDSSASIETEEDSKLTRKE